MLRELQIENIGIIEKLHMEFQSGLNVLTGETGAGKSIIIASFSLLLGQKIKPPELIRTGAQSGRVTGLLEIPENSGALHFLIQSNIPVSEGEILIQREIQLNGRSKCLINGQLVNTGILKDLGDRLVDIHGTHDHQKLLNSSTHILCLDRFGHTENEKTAYEEIFSQWTEEKQKLQQILQHQSLQKEKVDYLQFQLEELSYLEKVGQEEKDLEREHILLSDSSRIREVCESAIILGKEGDNSILSQLREFKSYVKELTSVDPQFTTPLEELESAAISLSESCNLIASLAQSVKPNPQRLFELEAFIAAIKKHELKYGTDLAGLKKMYETLKQEIQITRNPPDTEVIQKHIDELGEKALEGARQLTVRRKKTARQLEKAFEKELSDLGMAYSKVIVQFEKHDLDASGADKIEFLLTANPGESPKPLSKVASGGELCRIMLAFKAILASLDDIPILVFDEIDANIGGVTAVAAAEKMKAIAAARQVITITHQPQIAAKADLHFCVRKEQTKNHTKTLVNILDAEERVEEIARMLGGAEITSVVKKHAREMIQKKQ